MVFPKIIFTYIYIYVYTLKKKLVKKSWQTNSYHLESRVQGWTPTWSRNQSPPPSFYWVNPWIAVASRFHSDATKDLCNYETTQSFYRCLKWQICCGFAKFGSAVNSVKDSTVQNSKGSIFIFILTWLVTCEINF